MKKTYIIPTTLVVNIRIAKMIATSDPTIEMYGTNATGGGMSRRRGHSVWDDDDDDFDY